MPKNSGIHDGHRDRLRQKMADSGFSMPDHEILELLLFKDTPRKDTNETAHALLNGFGSLENILSADYRDLEKVLGVTKNAALHIAAMKLFFDRMQFRKTEGGEVINTFGDAEKFLRKHLYGLPREQCFLALMSAANKVIHTKTLAVGGFMGVKFELRPIIDEAVRTNAAKLLLAHNHPSGNYLPSAADKEVTTTLAQTLSQLGTELVDHIIISEKGAYSFLLDKALEHG